jgi:hypothetical protein
MRSRPFPGPTLQPPVSLHACCSKMPDEFLPLVNSISSRHAQTPATESFTSCNLMDPQPDSSCLLVNGSIFKLFWILDSGWMACLGFGLTE